MVRRHFWHPRRGHVFFIVKLRSEPKVHDCSSAHTRLIASLACASTLAHRRVCGEYMFVSLAYLCAGLGDSVCCCCCWWLAGLIAFTVEAGGVCISLGCGDRDPSLVSPAAIMVSHIPIRKAYGWNYEWYHTFGSSIVMISTAFKHPIFIMNVH